jgi:hypothetical protein
MMHGQQNVKLHAMICFKNLLLFFSLPVLVSEMAENIHYCAESSLFINWSYFRTVLSFLNVILIFVITFLILKRPHKLS